ncbi:MAG: LamG-like jellyroll fold domain-containing protein, partial [Planctomycetota bacterium]
MKRSIAVLLALGLLCVFCGTSQAALIGTDLGTPGVDPLIAGSYAEAAGVHTIVAGGSDIWGNDDAGYFAYEEFTGNPYVGDVQITARLVSVTMTNDWTKAGVMIRDDLTVGSKMTYMIGTPPDGNDNISFGRRPVADSGCTSDTVDYDESLYPPLWVRLVREDDDFTGFYSFDSTDGVDGIWTQVGGTQTIPMADSVYIGLAATSHNNDPGQSITAVLDNYSVVAPTVLTWDKTAWHEDGLDWTSANWLPAGPPGFPGASEIAVIEGDWTVPPPGPPVPAHPIIVNVTGDEAAAKLIMTNPGVDEDQGNYVWLRRTTGWDGGSGTPADTFGSLTVSRNIVAAERNNAVIMDQGTALNTGSGASEISALWWFGSDTHPGPDGAPGGGDDVQIPIEDVVVTTPGDVEILHRMNAVALPTDAPRRFVKRGAGTLSYDATSPGFQLWAATTTFRIEEGTFRAKGGDPLGGADGVELAGGTLDIAGAGGIWPDGIQAVYDFEEGGGDIIHDGSGVGAPLDLTIKTTVPSALASWGPGYLSLNGGDIGDVADPALETMAESGTATKIIDAVKASGEYSVEAWVVPANDTQTGPARVVNLGVHGTNCNAQLHQEEEEWVARFRTTDTNDYGAPYFGRGMGTAAVPGELTHVIYTRDASGDEFIYVNGVEEASGYRSGDVSVWDDTATLKLANEINLEGNREWTGEYHQVAIYNRALTSTEVDSQYMTGATPYSPPAALVLTDLDFTVEADSA